MKLRELFDINSNLEIAGITDDSRKAAPGYIFFCVEGIASDGHKFALSAAENGANVIVHSKDIPQKEGTIYIKVADTVDELNRVCNIFNNRASEKMTIFAITGTNGKSTIASVIKNVYGHRVPSGYIGTIGVEYGNVKKSPTLTTPSQVSLHAELKEMYDAGVRAAAIEASSHGLVQKRTASIDIDCAIFTQLTHEHLDYHGTMENYLEAKKILFKTIKKDGVAVLNADDDISIESLKECCNCRFVTYGLRDEIEADYKAKNIKLTPRYTDFVLVHGGREYQVRTNLIATYNISNILAVIAALSEMGMPLEEMIPLLDHIPQVDGRMEVVDEGQDYHVIVDFAHTPDAFEKVFDFAKKVIGENAKIYSVFGSSGRRDTTKRPIMGEIAGRCCDEIVCSQDDPRDEDPAEISRQILEGTKKAGGKGFYMHNRAEAIGYVIDKAEKGDLVLLLGMGHQLYIAQANNYKEPYDGDVAIAREKIRANLNKI